MLFELGDGSVSTNEEFWFINNWGKNELKINKAEIILYYENNLVVVDLIDKTNPIRIHDNRSMFHSMFLKEYAFKDKDNADANLVLLSLIR